MRVHELSKQLGISSKDLVKELLESGANVKSHMSSITDEEASKVREKHAGASIVAESEIEVEPVPTEPVPTEPEPETKSEADSQPEIEPSVEGEEPTAEEEPEEEKSRIITLKGPVVVRDFAEMLQLKPNQLIAELMSMNVFASISEKIDVKMAQQLARNHGYEVEQEKRKAERKQPPPQPKEEIVEQIIDQPEQLEARAPVVTFLGHVDHGKTSLLDRIRETRVAKNEHGGITQHIGAYSVSLQDKSITLLDTPGHAAFTAMRARGANLTDIAIIVIAADDGVMPQTREAIQHAKAAGVTIMIAINKIDLSRANVDRVKQQLQQEDLTTEDWGGETISCEVSAETGQGIRELLEMILLQAEVMELSANPNRKATGFVIEAKLEPGMGPTANVLVQKGTLNVGDAMVCGKSWGKVKALINDKGKKVRSVGPSVPVKVLGLTSVPEAGSKFEVYPNAKKAKFEVESRIADARQTRQEVPLRKASLDDLLSATNPNSKLELPVIVKTDVQGSTEALQHSLEEIQSEKIKLRILLAGVGNVTTNDVLLASASNAIILGFHVTKENGTDALSKREGVEIRFYNIIYELIDDIREAMTGMLAPDEREKVLGQAEIRQIFELSNKGRVAGCMIVKGRVSAKARARVRRGSDSVFDGRLMTLKRFQSDANEVREGQECGIRFEKFKDFEVGDIIETYDIERVAAQL